MRYQLTVVKLPLAKGIEKLDFSGTPINEGLVSELANGSFVDNWRNVVLIGGAETQARPSLPSPWSVRLPSSATQR